jgi:hypothetical protein
MPRIAGVDWLCQHIHGRFGEWRVLAAQQRAVDVDGRRHDVAFDLAGEDPGRDGRVQGAVAQLVVHDVVARRVGEGCSHGRFVAAVDPDALDPVAEWVRCQSARGDGDAVACLQEALNQQFAEIAGAAYNQYILAHGVSLSNRLYFLPVGHKHQTRKIKAMTKKNLCMEPF